MRKPAAARGVRLIEGEAKMERIFRHGYRLAGPRRRRRLRDSRDNSTTHRRRGAPIQALADGAVFDRRCSILGLVALHAENCWRRPSVPPEKLYLRERRSARGGGVAMLDCKGAKRIAFDRVWGAC